MPDSDVSKSPMTEVRNLLGCKHFKKPWQVYPICHTDSIRVAGIFCLSVVCQYVGKSINQHLGLPVPDIGSWKNMDNSLTTIPKFESHFSIVYLILWIMIYDLYFSFMVFVNSCYQKKHKLRPDCHVKTIRRRTGHGARREVLYVSGVPGTGKTASVLEAVRRLQAARRVDGLTRGWWGWGN
jgi:hypothetical protein